VNYGGHLWGEGKKCLVGSSYIRYSFLMYIVIVIYSSTFIYKNIREKKLPCLIVPLILIIHIVLTLNMLFYGTFGLQDTVKWKEQFYQIDKTVAKLPKNSVIITNLYGKAIVSRKVLNVELIKEEDKIKKREAVIKCINILLNNSYRVYLLEASFHKPTYLNLKRFIEEKGNLKLTEIDSKLYLYEIKK